MTSEALVRAAALASLVIAALMVGCGEQEVTLQPEAQGPTLSGLTLLNDRCTACHTLDRVKEASKTREGWEETVSNMVQRGADLDEREREVLVDYVAEVYGP